MDPTDATDQAGPDAPDVKTFRGRSLEEVLPRIRAELGPDAIVLRRREGLGGGVGGFFQRPYVEVDARSPQGDERPLEIRSDRATAEGLAPPAVQALFEQATPFADALAAAARDPRPLDEDTFSATIPRPEPPAPPREEPLPPPRSAGLYGPQPNVAAIEDVAPEPEPPAVAPEPPDCVTAEPEPEPEPDPEPAPRAVAPGLADEDDFVTAEAEPAPRAVAPEPADEDD